MKVNRKQGAEKEVLEVGNLEDTGVLISRPKYKFEEVYQSVTHIHNNEDFNPDWSN